MISQDLTTLVTLADEISSSDQDALSLDQMVPALRENMILAWYRGEPRTRYERILHLDPVADRMAVIELHNERTWPTWHTYSQVIAALETAEAVIMPEAEAVTAAEYYRLHSSDEQYVTCRAQKRRIKQRVIDDCARANKAWVAIQPIVDAPDLAAFEPEQRRRLAKAAAERCGIRVTTILCYLRRYWQGGQIPTALRPHYDESGAPGQRRRATDPITGNKRGRPSGKMRETGQDDGVNMTLLIEQSIRQGLALFHRDGASLKDAWEKTNKRFFAPGVQTMIGLMGEEISVVLPGQRNLAPTFAQFCAIKYRYDTPAENVKKKTGEHAYNTQHRAKTGNSTVGVLGPGYHYQIDATIADLYLVARWNRILIIGRPTLYFVIDTFSRMIVGFAVSMDPPSWAGAVIALENAMTDKVTFCAEYGITITLDMWPVVGVPRQVLGDRGEMIARHSNALGTELNIQIENTPPYRPDWKGIIERYFALVNGEVIHKLPGSVPRPRERGERDPRLDATLTLPDFRKILILCILEHNQTTVIPDYPYTDGMLQDGILATPLDLWTWGIRNTGGKLREVSANNIRYSLFPHSTAKVTQTGIVYDGMSYTGPTYVADEWGVQAGQAKDWPITVACNPRKAGALYWQKPDGQIEQLTVTSRDQWRSDWEWEEVHEQRAVEAAAKLQREGQAQYTAARFEAEREHIRTAAAQASERDHHGGKPRSGFKDMRAHAQTERDLDREGPGTSPAFTTQANNSLLDAGDGYIPPPPLISKFRAARQRQMDSSVEGGDCNASY